MTNVGQTIKHLKHTVCSEYAYIPWKYPGLHESPFRSTTLVSEGTAARLSSMKWWVDPWCRHELSARGGGDGLPFRLGDQLPDQ